MRRWSMRKQLTGTPSRTTIPWRRSTTAAAPSNSRAARTRVLPTSATARSSTMVHATTLVAWTRSRSTMTRRLRSLLFAPPGPTVAWTRMRTTTTPLRTPSLSRARATNSAAPIPPVSTTTQPPRWTTASAPRFTRAAPTLLLSTIWPFSTTSTTAAVLRAAPTPGTALTSVQQMLRRSMPSSVVP